MPTENKPTQPEVKRYRFKGAAGEYVYAGKFDNAVRCFLDAAESCIAAERREAELQLRLNAADQRIDELTQRQGEPVAWSYKFGGEQRFYPTDPRGSEAGAASHYITDVEPLYHHSAEQPELVSVVLDERVMAKPNSLTFYAAATRLT